MDKRDGRDDKSVAGIAGGNQMKIVVLAGGISPERDVSLCSGKMIYQALCRRGHQALLLDVYLGYEGDLTDIFEISRELTAETGTINDKNPDLDQIRAMRPDGKEFFRAACDCSLPAGRYCVSGASRGKWREWQNPGGV